MSKQDSEARNHHFVPQFYLREFAEVPGKKAQIWVADRQSGRFFKTSVRNVGSKRDFNRVDVEGHRPDALERGLSSFEDEAKAAVQEVSKTKSFSNENSRVAILNLIALLAIRSPRVRRIFSDFEKRVMRSALNMTLATEERWKSAVRGMKASGFEVPPSVTYEQMRDFARSDRYTIDINATHHIGLEFKNFEAILRTVADRKWTLMNAERGAGDFITCDHPVCLSSTSPSRGMFRVGHGMRGTSLFFPLTKRMALLGQFEGRNADVNVDFFEVAAMNWNTMLCSDRQIYAPNENFNYLSGGNYIKSGIEIVKEAAFVRPAESDECIPDENETLI